MTVATTGSSSNPYMFAATSGYRNDGDAGLMHVGARYYDSQVGGFITRDTYLDQKPYLYCGHDPVNCLDPSGHDFWSWVKVFLFGEKFGGGLAIGIGIGEGAVAIEEIHHAYEIRDKFRKKREGNPDTWIGSRPDDPGAGSDRRRSDPKWKTKPSTWSGYGEDDR